jgi:hypothetical protein
LRLHWKNGLKSFEFKMAEIYCHGVCGSVITALILDAIINACYINGTMRWNSSLTCVATSNIPIYYNLPIAHLALTLTGLGRSPDFQIGFPGIEPMSFIVGEVGFSDSRALTNRRVLRWMVDNQGSVTLSLPSVISFLDTIGNCHRYCYIVESKSQSHRPI